MKQHDTPHNKLAHKSWFVQVFTMKHYKTMYMNVKKKVYNSLFYIFFMHLQRHMHVLVERKHVILILLDICKYYNQ